MALNGDENSLTPIFSSDKYQVFTTYGIDQDQGTPPHPGQSWTRFVCISDTHSSHVQLPEGDVLLHSGDLTSTGTPQEVESDLEWLQKQSHPLKILIAGNHDLCLDENISSNQFPELLNDVDTIRAKLRSPAVHQSGLYYLEHESVSITTVMGTQWKIYGSPATPFHAKGAFQYDPKTKEGEELYSSIPNDTQILLTHTPPRRTLDMTRKRRHVGCEHLASRLKHLKNLRLHCFGHIHEAFGVEVSGDKVSVNAAVVNSGLVVIVDLHV